MKVLNALPKERFDYTPHERSPSAAQIVWTLALETKACSDLSDAGRVNWKPDLLPADPETILSSFRRHSAELDRRIERLDEDVWQSKAQLLVNDQLYLAWRE